MSGGRLHVVLSREVDLLLARAAKASGATKTAIVDAALREALDRKSDERVLDKLANRLAKLTRAMERLADDGTAQTESFALFILHYLSVTPPLPEAMRAAAEAQGRRRFDQFVTQVSARLLGRERYADALLARIDLVRHDSATSAADATDADHGALDDDLPSDAAPHSGAALTEAAA